MSKMLSRLLGRPCTHEHTLVVRTHKVERIVCEGCGYVSFTMMSNDADGYEQWRAESSVPVSR